MKELARGESLKLEYRGKAVAILNPVKEEFKDKEDPLRSIGSISQTGLGSLDEFSIDDVLYGANSNLH